MEFEYKYLLIYTSIYSKNTVFKTGMSIFHDIGSIDEIPVVIVGLFQLKW